MARSRKAKDKPAAGKRRIEQYDHKGQQRKNNPPVGLVTEATDRDAPKHQYAYDPHLDPTLTWAGKAEHTSFEVPTVSLHVHERIDPKTIVEAVRRRNGTSAPVQRSLFESAEENPPLREAIDFYQHAHAWSNRLIAGDSPPEQEGMARLHRRSQAEGRTKPGKQRPCREVPTEFSEGTCAAWSCHP